MFNKSFEKEEKRDKSPFSSYSKDFSSYSKDIDSLY